MADMHQLIHHFKETASAGVRREITGRNALIRNLFEYLFKRVRLDYDLLLLCTKKGLILDCFSPELSDSLAGYSIDSSFFVPYQNMLSFNENSQEFKLIFSAAEETVPQLNQLHTNLKMLLNIVDSSTGHQQYLLDCFDAIDNAICIYDSNAALLYGNKRYLDIMQIHDRESAVGMNILDITRESGIKIQATKNGSSNLKMLDVLKSGNKLLDWEVKVESQTVANKAQFVSNNMYPIKNKSGGIDGIIEVSSSHQVSLKKMKKIMGLTAEYTFDSIVGESPAIAQIKTQAMEYARSPYNLLIVGESGVGKELFAQAIHNYSDRKHEPFVALNCANFPENLIESELFGYVGGAFTGASKNGQIGKFELADGGTLFLDEVGELPLHFQSKLLRVLETHRITRIGSSSETPVNVRVLAATNRDLEEMVEEGLFRKDLYYRLQVLSIEIPPLRERHQDLLLLSDAFFRQAAEMNGEEKKELNPAAQRALMAYDWPGNVRELRNVIHRITLLAKSKTVTEDVLEAAIHSKRYVLKSAAAESQSPEDKLEKCMKDIDHSYVQLLKTALEASEGNKKQAAELIGVSRRTFYRMLEKYKL